MTALDVESAFEAFPKIPRLSKPIVVTEKIDGTNAAIVVRERDIYAQSRKRIITPDDDNFGFAAWVAEHADELGGFLGEGRHFGEWWGSGIQRGYDLEERRFSLFNTGRWPRWYVQEELGSIGLDVVPVLATSPVFDSYVIESALIDLAEYGSRAEYGYDRPEGVVVFHAGSRQIYKRLLENDDVPKSLVDSGEQAR